MKLTLSDLIKLAQDGAGKDTTTASQTFLKQRINSRYETVLSVLPSHYSEITRTFNTVADQQYYHYPPSMREIKDLHVTIGTVDYRLLPVQSYEQWTHLNAIDFQAGAIPEYYFKRQRDFGIWPIPGDAYTSTLTHTFRAQGMTITDKTAGTVAVTENDATVTLSGDTWSAAEVKADMWFSLADANGESRGDWYRIASRTDTTNMELESVFEGATESGASYIIGECPELPDELHELLAWGALADYFASFRQAVAKAQGWNNMFWTGDWNNSSRDPSKSYGGLLGYMRNYEDRHNTQLIRRTNAGRLVNSKVFATTLSDS